MKVGHEIVELHDISMTELLTLSHTTFQFLDRLRIIGYMFVKNLKSDVTIERFIARQPDLPNPAPA